MTAVRHSTSIMRRANELAEVGWAINDVRRLLHDEFGIRPSRQTIYRWIDPDYAERVRERMREHNARRWAPRWRFNLLERATPECRAAFIRRLHDAHVPAPSIAKVCTILFSEPTTRHQVSYLLSKDAS